MPWYSPLHLLFPIQVLLSPEPQWPGCGFSLLYCEIYNRIESRDSGVLFPFGQYNFHYGWARNLGQREEALVSRPCPTEAGNPDAVNQITSSFPALFLLCLSFLLRLSPCLGLTAIHAPWARAQDKMFRQEPHVAEWHVCLCNELVVCLVTQHYKGNLVHHLGVSAIKSYDEQDAPGRPFPTCCPPDGPDYKAQNSQPVSTLSAG